LDLTIYEFINVVWKHVYLLKHLNEEGRRLIRAFLEQNVEVISVESLPPDLILQKALEHGITAHDAAYIVAAL
jgi:predicted nucleic acid-binding protein